MKQVTLCIFGDGYNEPNNCEIDLEAEEWGHIPVIGDAVNLPGMKRSQIVRSRSFNYSPTRTLIILNDEHHGSIS
jgi:hypothetical protein